MTKKLKIAKFMVSTDVNGPGRRFVIWLQGCHLRCKGCINPEFWSEDSGTLMHIDDIMAEINNLDLSIEGITFTGGEPLLQAEALLPLAQRVKSQGLSILCYTGYLLEEILDNKIPYAKELLRFVDILIDGPYIEKEKAPLLWRGSRNQKVYFLTDRYKYLEPLIAKEGQREVELQIGREGLTITGFFEKEMWEKLIHILKERG